MRVYVVWNYWDHRIVKMTNQYMEASDALHKARKTNPTIEEIWFGIEAVYDMNKVPVHLINFKND